MIQEQNAESEKLDPTKENPALEKLVFHNLASYSRQIADLYDDMGRTYDASFDIALETTNQRHGGALKKLADKQERGLKMAGIWQRPVGRGLAVLHHPDKWEAWIPAENGRFEVHLADYPKSENAMLSIEEIGNPSNALPVVANKALLCDFAWAILRQFEVPTIQEELTKLERKANR
ncbi:MAG: hypothetical protein LCH63_10260 [Candidatus Melainabacteria bacterium]|nr:hypothetical protein [Candidatus Melainabacteria bacterium]